MMVVACLGGAVSKIRQSTLINYEDLGQEQKDEVLILYQYGALKDFLVRVLFFSQLRK